LDFVLKAKKDFTCCEAKAGSGKKSLAFLVLFEEIDALKRQLKPEKTTSHKKRKAESLLYCLY
jgi:hypothetical protein